jgi:hypothetical protein
MLDAPGRIVAELSSFMDQTEPFEYTAEQVRERLQRGPTGRNKNERSAR